MWVQLGSEQGSRQRPRRHGRGRLYAGSRPHSRAGAGGATRNLRFHKLLRGPLAVTSGRLLEGQLEVADQDTEHQLWKSRAPHCPPIPGGAGAASPTPPGVRGSHGAGGGRGYHHRAGQPGSPQSPPGGDAQGCPLVCLCPFSGGAPPSQGDRSLSDSPFHEQTWTPPPRVCFSDFLMGLEWPVPLTHGLMGKGVQPSPPGPPDTQI